MKSISLELGKKFESLCESLRKKGFTKKTLKENDKKMVEYLFKIEKNIKTDMVNETFTLNPTRSFKEFNLDLTYAKRETFKIESKIKMIFKIQILIESLTKKRKKTSYPKIYIGFNSFEIGNHRKIDFNNLFQDPRMSAFSHEHAMKILPLIPRLYHLKTFEQDFEHFIEKIDDIIDFSQRIVKDSSPILKDLYLKEITSSLNYHKHMLQYNQLLDYIYECLKHRDIIQPLIDNTNQ